MNFKSVLFTSTAVAILFVSQLSFAAGRDSGGGDLQCDSKIKTISANIGSWIKGGGPEVGKLDLSSSHFQKENRPYSFAEYDSAMLALLNLPLNSSCVTKGDPGYPVQVGDDSKICSSFVDNGQVHMKCDQAKFLGMSPDQQIEQIHHEYAINVPGLEPDYGPISTYKISLQLSAYTQYVTERRLVVMKPTSSGVPNLTDLLRRINGLPRLLTYVAAETYCKSIGSRLPTSHEFAYWAQSKGLIQIKDTQYPNDFVEDSQDLQDEKEMNKELGFDAATNWGSYPKTMIEYYWSNGADAQHSPSDLNTWTSTPNKSYDGEEAYIDVYDETINQPLMSSNSPTDSQPPTGGVRCIAPTPAAK